MTNMGILSVKDYKSYFEKGISYEAYQKNFQDEIAMGEKCKFAEYLPQNWSRQSRLDRKLKLNETLLSAIKNNDQKQNWLLISEHWCGDASQINPVINKVASQSEGLISLSIVYRDENDPLMDAHLTDGRSRSIPILIKLDENFNVLKAYGPRPKEAQKLVMDLLAKGEDYNLTLHTWYAKDKQISIQEDLLNLLK